jgi:hypothetical protein
MFLRHTKASGGNSVTEQRHDSNATDPKDVPKQQTPASSNTRSDAIPFTCKLCMSSNHPPAHSAAGFHWQPNCFKHLGLLMSGHDLTNAQPHPLQQYQQSIIGLLLCVSAPTQYVSCMRTSCQDMFAAVLLAEKKQHSMLACMHII